MRCLSFAVLSTAVLTLCASAPSEAQQRETGTISGVVTVGATGTSVAGAQVRIAGSQLGAATGAEGRFTIANVPVGSQSVQVRMLGYTATERIVTVRSEERRVGKE